MEDQEKKDRTQRCIDRINQILTEENCQMEPFIKIIGNKIVDPQVLIIAKDLVKPEESKVEQLIEGEVING